MQLLEYHSHVLANEGRGLWKLHTVDEFERALKAKQRPRHHEHGTE
jgi:hypothetical protein